MFFSHYQGDTDVENTLDRFAVYKQTVYDSTTTCFTCLIQLKKVAGQIRRQVYPVSIHRAYTCDMFSRNCFRQMRLACPPSHALLSSLYCKTTHVELRILWATKHSRARTVMPSVSEGFVCQLITHHPRGRFSGFPRSDNRDLDELLLTSSIQSSYV